MNTLIIYTDGGARPTNPGPGGWGAVILNHPDEIEYHLSGGARQTTNNRMELMAVIEALQFTDDLPDQPVHFHSDSQYVINCASGKWARRKNVDLWRLYEQVSRHRTIEWTWVKGHSNDHYNEIADQLATDEALRSGSAKKVSGR